MTQAIQQASWRDYYQLTKPKVVALMMVTTLVGMALASPGWIPLNALIVGNIGIALCAGSAACVNHLVDEEIDQRMARTQGRPVAAGRVPVRNAVIFAAVTAALGAGILAYGVNMLTAWLTLASLIGYAFIYTLLLKRATPQNIVIGGLAGAAPPLLGWTSVTGSIDPEALLLVLIIFAWTPPHFWALAIHRKDEYAKVNVPMLPVTDVHPSKGGGGTRKATNHDVLRCRALKQQGVDKGVTDQTGQREPGGQQVYAIGQNPSTQSGRYRGKDHSIFNRNTARGDGAALGSSHALIDFLINQVVHASRRACTQGNPNITQNQRIQRDPTRTGQCHTNKRRDHH